jgi:hypothetical protein
MNIFEPLITQQSPSRRARVFRPATSEPASGSVTAIEQTVSPRMIAGRYFCFCADVPRRVMCTADMSECTRVDEVKPPKEERPSSSAKTIEESGPMSVPPYSASWRMPRKPSAPMRRKISRGIFPSRSHASPCGTTSFSTKRRTCSRSILSSSGRFSGSAK